MPDVDAILEEVKSVESEGNITFINLTAGAKYLLVFDANALAYSVGLKHIPEALKVKFGIEVLSVGVDAKPADAMKLYKIIKEPSECPQAER